MFSVAREKLECSGRRSAAIESISMEEEVDITEHLYRPWESGE
jgi:hypothetical protein